MGIKNIVRNERTWLAAFALFKLVLDRLAGRFRSAFYTGHLKGYIGSNARIVGSRHIVWSGSVFLMQDCWIEAVTSYRKILYRPRIVVGTGLSASPALHVSAIHSISIGDRCLFGSNVFITDHGHGKYKDGNLYGTSVAPADRPLETIKPVVIGKNCWIGNNVCVLGASIGDGSIVGANSVVTRDLPSGVIAVGIPAKIIKEFNQESGKWASVTTGI